MSEPHENLGAEFGLNNKFVNRYLQYTYMTEPPKIMHVWAILSAVSAALGRRCYLDNGGFPIYPNMFVALVGHSGLRKTTAMNYAKKLVELNTGVRIAPKDTAGQRQGLITAMSGLATKTVGDELDEMFSTGSLEDEDLMAKALETMGELEIAKVTAKVPDVLNPDRHAIYACSAELRSFIGQNNSDFTGFLLEMWDGEPYGYQLKESRVVLSDPLLNLIGCTTPHDLALILPPDSVGQGFMSRFILVFAEKRYRDVPVSRIKLCMESKEMIERRLHKIFNEISGGFKMSDAAQEHENELYLTKKTNLHDTRFVYYAERRHTHMLKLAMAFAAMRLSKVVEVIDIDEADTILTYTEKTMTEALGEFGLSPVAVAKQKLVDFLKNAEGPVTPTVLWLVMSRDMIKVAFNQVMQDLLDAQKVTLVKTNEGVAYLYIQPMASEIDNLLEAEAIKKRKRG